MKIRNVKYSGGSRRPWQGPAFGWGLAVLLAAAAGVLLSYWWRVFFYMDSRLPGLVTTLLCVGFALGVVGAAAVLRFCCKSFAARGAVCIALCGLLFVFANPPLQAPDEHSHYLRTYAISQGRLDFDAARGYPRDVAALVQAFPAAWVNAHTSVGIGVDPITGGEKPYDSAGYALKQYGDTAPIEGITEAFARYTALRAEESPDPVTEPLNFLVLPFLPGALGMALARLLGLGALGCLYAGRMGNLLAYAAMGYAALRLAQRCRPLLLAFFLLPLSLYMAASLSYDATLLGGYFVLLALLTRPAWNARTAALYGLVCVYVNIAKPYLNLLWVFLPLLVTLRDWQPKRCKRRWLIMGALVGAVAVTLLVEWYGVAFRFHYPAVIDRQGGESVNGAAQLLFILQYPLRYVAASLGTLYENDLFIGQLGLFGSLDLPVPLLNLASPLVLALAALLCAGPGQGLGKRRTVGLGVFGAVYMAGIMTAMYITYTPVAMVRIVGLQARYFLPVYLALGFGAAAVLRRLLRPALAPQRADALALPLLGGYAALGGLLLFQHYFIGPFYTIPV